MDIGGNRFLKRYDYFSKKSEEIKKMKNPIIETIIKDRPKSKK